MYEIGRGQPSATLAVPLSSWEAVSLLSQGKTGSSPAQMLHWGKGRFWRGLREEVSGGRRDRSLGKGKTFLEGILCCVPASFSTLELNRFGNLVDLVWL